MSSEFKHTWKQNCEWIVSRTKEIPFLLRNPQIIANKFRRMNIRNEMKKIIPETKIIKLSNILPSHTIEGLTVAEIKKRKRVIELEKKKYDIDHYVNNNQPIPQTFFYQIMDSSTEIQLAFDRSSQICVALDGNGRLIAIKEFFAMHYPNIDPDVEIKVYPMSFFFKGNYPSEIELCSVSPFKYGVF